MREMLTKRNELHIYSGDLQRITLGFEASIMPIMLFKGGSYCLSIMLGFPLKTDSFKNEIPWPGIGILALNSLQKGCWNYAIDISSMHPGSKFDGRMFGADTCFATNDA